MAPLTDASRGSGGGGRDRRVFVQTIKDEHLGTQGMVYVQVCVFTIHPWSYQQQLPCAA